MIYAIRKYDKDVILIEENEYHKMFTSYGGRKPSNSTRIMAFDALGNKDAILVANVTLDPFVNEVQKDDRQKKRKSKLNVGH